MNNEEQARSNWIKHYQSSGNLGLTCLRCGISRPTLRKWLRRYEQLGPDGLVSLSRKPHNSPNRKIHTEQEKQVLSLRQESNLGTRRIQNELKRQHKLSLSLATIHKILVTNKVKPLKRPKRPPKVLRYSRSIPGERIQMDTCKISAGIYQFTAVDDCTRYQVIEIYSTRQPANTILFLEKVIEEMRFPVQSIQTDRGREFFAYKVQEWLKEYCIKFRPVRPGQPHLNGKVERAQQTDLIEFWALADLTSDQLRNRLAEYQQYYNWDRVHGSIGKTPMDRVIELSQKIPFWDEVEEKYDSSQELLRMHDYAKDMKLLKLKRSL